MKKWTALILALVMCLSLCACGGGKGETPFDLLLESSDVSDAISKYGEPDYNNFDSGFDQGDRYLFSAAYKNYECFGYLGELSINSTVLKTRDEATNLLMEAAIASGSYTLSIKGADWHFVASDNNVSVEQAFEKIIKVMDGRFGEHTREDGDYLWYDTIGNKYTLRVVGSQEVHLRYDT